jgi:hypothetical protein
LIPFYTVQRELAEKGIDYVETKNVVNLEWIGDKKPVQHCDPEIRSFLARLLPKARYLHIVRDPRAAVASAMNAISQWGGGVPDYWRKGPNHILERWVIHEEWVEQAKAQDQLHIMTMRLEDLTANPLETMEGVFRFLGIEMPDTTAGEIKNRVRPDPNRKYSSFILPDSEKASRMMQIYGYKE